jgi:hypothetical protein
MAEYRIYTFQGGHIQKAESVELEDDSAAFNYASVATGGTAFEVWKGAQMIVSIDAPAPDMAAKIA